MNKKVAILGCARDIARYLHQTMKTIKTIADMFEDHRVYIYENDSIDETNKILIEYQKANPKIKVFSERFLKNRYHYRTWLLAYAREKLKENLIKDNFNPDYVIVLDLDDVGQYSTNAKKFISESLKLREHWDGIFPHPTYDKWAYRSFNCKYNYWEVKNYFSKYFPNFKKDKYLNFLGGRKDLLPNSHGLCRVLSSFNGIAMYKYNVYIQGQYSGVNNFFTMIQDVALRAKIMPEECEHVNFHRSLGENTKLMILYNCMYV